MTSRIRRDLDPDLDLPTSTSTSLDLDLDLDLDPDLDLDLDPDLDLRPRPADRRHTDRAAIASPIGRRVRGEAINRRKTRAARALQRTRAGVLKMRTVVGFSLLFSMFALACGAPEPESLGKTKGRSGDASSAEQAYADPMGAPLEDGGAMGPVTDPTTPPPPPTPAPVDGGAIGDAAFPIPPPPDASQVGTNGRVPCYDLAYCCAMAKPCDAETVACVKVVQTQDPTACLAALEGYKIIKCIHGDEANASFLPGFAGCQPDWGWGY